MAKTFIRVRGGRRVMGKFREIGRAGFLDRVMWKWVKDKASRLRAKRYPPERPGQRYIRTGKLGAAWVGVRVGSLLHHIRNWVRGKKGFYAATVVGPSQGFYFVNRWWQATPFLKADKPTLGDVIAEAYKDAF